MALNRLIGLGTIFFSSLSLDSITSKTAQEISSQGMILEGIVTKEESYDTLDYDHFKNKNYMRHFHYFELETSDKKKFILSSVDLNAHYIDLMLDKGDYVKLNAPRYGFLGTNYREIFFDCVIEVKRKNPKR